MIFWCKEKKFTKKKPQGSTSKWTFMISQGNDLKLLSSNIKDVRWHDWARSTAAAWQALMRAETLLTEGMNPEVISEWLIRALFVSGAQPYASILLTGSTQVALKQGRKWTR